LELKSSYDIIMEREFRQEIIDEALEKDNEEYQKEKEIVMDRIRRKI